MNDTKQILQAMASAIDEALNEKGKPKQNGFVLLVFPFDGPEGQLTNYVSNGQRQDVLVALKEVVARFEGQSQHRGRA